MINCVDAGGGTASGRGTSRVLLLQLLLLQWLSHRRGMLLGTDAVLLIHLRLIGCYKACGIGTDYSDQILWPASICPQS